MRHVYFDLERKRLSSGGFLHYPAHRCGDRSYAHVHLTPTDSTQDEAGRLTLQHLVYPTWRQWRIVIGQEHSENSRGQRHMVSKVIRLLAAMSADHVPQDINPLDFASVQTHPVKLFRLAVCVLGLAFRAQLGVQVNPQVSPLLLPPIEIDVKLGVQRWFYISSHSLLGF